MFIRRFLSQSCLVDKAEKSSQRKRSGILSNFYKNVCACVYKSKNICKEKFENITLINSSKSTCNVYMCETASAWVVSLRHQKGCNYYTWKKYNKTTIPLSSPKHKHRIQLETLTIFPNALSRIHWGALWANVPLQIQQILHLKDWPFFPLQNQKIFQSPNITNPTENLHELHNSLILQIAELAKHTHLVLTSDPVTCCLQSLCFIFQ